MVRSPRRTKFDDTMESRMAAYFFVDILEITDPAKMEDYRSRVRACVERAGGRYVVLGGKCDVVEGDWRPTFPVLLEFPTLADARRWYDSDDYRPLPKLRLEATRCNAVFDGMMPIP